MDEQPSSTAAAPIVGARFDLIGLAVRRPTDLWPMMAGALGGRYDGRGTMPGYGWTQVRFANGFVVQGLNPEPNHGTDFLERFLDRDGPGPHHLTFHVPDLEVAVASLDAHGIAPVALDRSDPNWLELLIHPRDGQGIVVQLVQVPDRPPPPLDLPEGFPEISYDHPVASLGRVVHAVADMGAALAMYRDLLGGRVVSSGSAVDGNHWTELGWEGPGRLRLLEAAHAEIADWVGDRRGRVRHLFFDFDEPSHIPGARQVSAGRGRWVVDADDVLGTRLVIASSAR